MLGGIKKILGIEGISMEIVVPESIDYEKTKKLEGYVKLLAKGDSEIKSISFKLIEKYQRGRKESKLIDEYIIGYTELDGPITLEKGQSHEMQFTLPIKIKLSEIEQFGDRNFLFKGFSSIAKIVKGAKSTFRIEAEAYVVGTKLHPLAKKDIMIDY